MECTRLRAANKTGGPQVSLDGQNRPRGVPGASNNQYMVSKLPKCGPYGAFKPGGQYGTKIACVNWHVNCGA